MKSHGIPDDDNDHLLKNPNTSLDTSFMTDESESFIEESIFLKVRNKLKQQHQVTNKSIEIANVKHLPTLFFIIQLLLLSLLLVNFIPQTYSTFKTSSLYKEKMRLKYIPEYFGEQTSTVKVK